ncbi:unnamed protein product [Tilletia controversa]|nr:unnamed protein product [Tilletia controversa]
MFQKVKDRVSAAAADPRLDKTKAGLKKAETGLWKALEPVGKWSNKTAGKLGAESFWPTTLDLECDKAARILRTFTVSGAQADADPSAERTGGVVGGATKTPQQIDAERKLHKYDDRKTQKVVKKIPHEIIASAKGLAIFTVFRTGLGFSGPGGSGVVLKRLPDGSWSGPSGLLLHTIGWGFLIGLDIYDVVLVLRTDKAVEAFRNPKISVGAEIAVAAGPVGNGVMLDSGPEASPAFSYVKSKGFYAGLQLDGNIILKRKDENSRFYGIPDVSTADIFSGRVPAPRAAYPLLKTIYAAEGRPSPTTSSSSSQQKLQYLAPDVVIPEGPAPGDLYLSPEDAAALEEEAKAHDQGQGSQSQQAQGQGQGQGYGYGAGSSAGTGASANANAGVPGGQVLNHSAAVAGPGSTSTTSTMPGSAYPPPSSNPGSTDQTYQNTYASGATPASTSVHGAGPSAAPASYVAGPGGGALGSAAVLAAAAGTAAGHLPDRKESEVWEQPPPDYDFSTAPPASMQQQHQQQQQQQYPLPPAPVPATSSASAPGTAPSTQNYPLPPPPAAAPLSAEEEKERLSRADAPTYHSSAPGQGPSAAPLPPPPVPAAAAPLSAEEEKEQLKRRYEAERAAEAAAASDASGAGAGGSGAPSYQAGPGQGQYP